MITLEQMEALRRYDSPTICNAMETFNIRSRIEGYLHYSIKAQFPCERPIIGYAAPAKFVTSREGEGIPLSAYFRYVQSCPAPSIAVFQDMDYPDCKAAMIGEVMSTALKAVGCEACVTNGGVRDMKEVRALNFGYFSTGVMVSHGYLRCVEYGTPVELMGVTVNPGDLLFCDDQGIVIIPESVVADLPAACAQVAGVEAATLALCREAILYNKKLDCDKLDEIMGKYLSDIAP